MSTGHVMLLVLLGTGALGALAVVIGTARELHDDFQEAFGDCVETTWSIAPGGISLERWLIPLQSVRLADGDTAG